MVKKEPKESKKGQPAVKETQKKSAAKAKGEPKKKQTGNVEGSAKPETKAAKLIAQGKTCLGALDVIVPLAYYQRTVKPKDAEMKIEKGLDLVTALENEGSEDAKNLAKELQTKTETTLKWIETLQIFSFEFVEENEVSKTLQSFEVADLERLCLLPADCLNALISDIGRRLVEEF